MSLLKNNCSFPDVFVFECQELRLMSGPFYLLYVRNGCLDVPNIVFKYSGDVSFVLQSFFFIFFLLSFIYTGEALVHSIFLGRPSHLTLR